MQALIIGVITAVIAVVLFTGTLMPTLKNASAEFARVNATTTLTTSETSLFGITGIVVIAGLIMIVLKIVG